MESFELYRRIMEDVNGILWNRFGDAEKAFDPDARVMALREEKERCKKIIAAYVDAYAAMIEEISFNSEFRWLPMRAPAGPEAMNIAFQRIWTEAAPSRQADGWKQGTDAPSQ